MSLSLRFSTLLLLQPFLFSSASVIAKDVWHISIDEGPAPPPQDSPPLSVSAIRDKSFLPVQIGSIVGAYLLSVLIIGTALLLVGRRLRRAAQESPRSLAMEMVRPVHNDVAKAFDPSPISPSLKNPYGPSPVSTIDMKSSWPSPDKKRMSNPWGAKSHRQQTSIQSSVVTFDGSVVEDDKAKNQREMERLYAAVMEHDEEKAKSVPNSLDEPQPQYPPELQHLRFCSGSQQPSSPPPRTITKSPTRTLTTSPQKSVTASKRPTPVTTSRATTHSGNSSRSSFGSFSKRRGVRHLPISPPMGSPDLVPENLSKYGEAEPLSPRYYDPGPPPPTPPNPCISRTQDEQDNSIQPSPKRAEFGNWIRTPRTSIPTIQAPPEIENSSDGSHQVQGEPQPPPRLYNKAKRTPAPLALRTLAAAAPSPNLPLRSAPLPLRNLNPNSDYSDRPRSIIKATVLERKVPDIHHLRTPRTGVPMTPYSPYMPYTPLTPMTPSRLVTKQERRKREKEEGRRVATVEDAVVEESDMWGDGYH
ncbi:hypothetical protein MMC12_007679 [Toensbergia leucococca]|nr:hypothetical protein [Toensbergia leucococca]